MRELTNTQFFQVESGPQIQAKDILEIVYKALSEKGYNPVNQIVGYIMSGDPTYITSHNGCLLYTSTRAADFKNGNSCYYRTLIADVSPGILEAHKLIVKMNQ